MSRAFLRLASKLQAQRYSIFLQQSWKIGNPYLNCLSQSIARAPNISLPRELYRYAHDVLSCVFEPDDLHNPIRFQHHTAVRFPRPTLLQSPLIEGLQIWFVPREARSHWWQESWRDHLS